VSLTLVALAGLLLSSPSDAAPRTVAVRVLERLHPKTLQLSGLVPHQLEARGATLEVDGLPVGQPWKAPAAEWRVSLPGEVPRRYTGGLSVRAVEGELALVLRLPLEAYVALVVASETLPGTPQEALRAQAVVARSFLLAQGPRHEEADVCDLAHCQVLRGSGVSQAHLAAARAATFATEGRVLLLSSGAVAETPFHAACGGHTGDPEEVFGSASTGAEAVADSGCPAEAWEASVPLSRFRAALGPLLSNPAHPGPLQPETLGLLTGRGGYVVRVVAPEGGSARGDAVARALDREAGWGAVRSGRFTFRLEGESVRVRGAGLGHGLGLCQAGAASRAQRGEGYPAILRHYFPLATLR
jgi:stage II sporulation protein D